MFSQVWKKYLPVITILIKRSANGDQVLAMNHLDFGRAAGGRKIKFSFSGLKLNKGRVENGSTQLAHAKELAVVLQEDPFMSKFMKDKYLEFSMTLSFQLSIKQIALPGAETLPGATIDADGNALPTES
jgi:hypothetical protein